MKGTVIEKIANYGYTGQSHKLTLVGYLKTGEHVTLNLEDDGGFGNSIASKLNVGDELELTISINKKETRITRYDLI